MSKTITWTAALLGSMALAGREQARTGHPGDRITGVLHRTVDDLLDRRGDQHAHQAAVVAAVAFLAGGGRRAGPQGGAGSQVDQLGAGGDDGRAADHHVARAVVAHRDVQRRVGAIDLAQLGRGHLVHVAGAGQAVLAEGLVGQRHRHHVVAGLGQREGDLREHAVGRLHVGRLVQRRQDQDRARLGLLERRVIDALGRRAAAEQGQQGETGHQAGQSGEFQRAPPRALFRRKSM